MCKRRIGVIFGGCSAEHEVSCKSAAFVMEALDGDKFQPIYIGITKDGSWKLFDGPIQSVEAGDWLQYTKDFDLGVLKETVDFVLPVLHGPHGEDGTIQGMFEMLNIPYGGCGVMASAAAMDKQVFKDIMKAQGLPVCGYLAFTKTQIIESFDEVKNQIEEKIGFPCFVKPANMGSSVGISKVCHADKLRAALRVATCYDKRILIEEFIPCRELEVAILGNNIIEASFVGEIMPAKEFYDYEAKYLDSSTQSELMIPADLSPEAAEELQELAIRTFKAIDGEGFGRVDFFKRRDNGHIYINEVNTIPGFTEKSMFPLLWQAQGLSPREMIERIIDLGYEKYYAKNCR